MTDITEAETDEQPPVRQREDHFQLLRYLEAMLFASAEPVAVAALVARMPDGTDVPALLEELSALYANRGVNLVHREGRWAFRTAADLAAHMQIETEVPRKLSRAAVETLAIIAYHQPVTRGEIEEVRGVALSRGTLDTLLEAGWIRPKGRRRTPGRPVTWVTTDAFLDHFGLESRDALPGIEELKAAGLLETGSAVSTLGMQAMAAAMPPGDGGEEREDGQEDDQSEDGEDAGELDEEALIAGLDDLPDED